jgi:hypothetical protein
MNDEPAAQAHALLERLFALLRDCRAVVPQLEAGGVSESMSAQAERLLYYALVGALEAGLVRTAEDALTVLRQASQPLGPMGAEWLKRPEAMTPPRWVDEHGRPRPTRPCPRCGARSRSTAGR